MFAAEHRRTPIILIAAWLVVLQAFLAGVVTGQAGAMSASAPLDAAICHGAGASDAGDPATPAEAAWHLCCASCTSTAPPLLPAGAAAAMAPRSQRAERTVPNAGFILVIARRAVRAGSSQAPPSHA
jgi:hypothetical protein